MYRIIFVHYPKADKEKEFIAQWQKGSDIIQSYRGAMGTKLFRDQNKPGVLFAIADWENKEARDDAMKKIKEERADAEEILHGHSEYTDSHEIFAQLKLIAESNHK